MRDQQICFLSRSAFRGKVLRQNGFRTKLCVSEMAFDSSLQAHWAGDLRSQKRRISGFSDTWSFHFAHGLAFPFLPTAAPIELQSRSTVPFPLADAMSTTR
jgi:hypothetical protein